MLLPNKMSRGTYQGLPILNFRLSSEDDSIGLGQSNESAPEGEESFLNSSCVQRESPSPSISMAPHFDLEEPPHLKFFKALTVDTSGGAPWGPEPGGAGGGAAAPRFWRKVFQ